jgi:LysR family transcriptional regulator, glycine cleavage system transcriptional activator
MTRSRGVKDRKTTSDRRLLPPLDALYVFSVAARHRSFTTAAAELHRTQSAVSHRIKGLEAEVGVQLFRRGRDGLTLTAAGEALAAQVARSITELARAVAEIGHAGASRRLRVTMLPSVASRWLMSRLPRFCEQHPEMEVQVIADPDILDLRSEGIDLAIRFGHGRYRDHATTLLMRDRVLPVCSPELIARHGPVATFDALLSLPLLHDSSTEGDGSLSDWRSWLDELGRADLPCQVGQRFSHAGLSIEAAIIGMGVALARLSLVTDHLARGELISPFPLTTATAFSYYLVALPEAAALPKVVLFSQWLQAEAGDTVAGAAQPYSGEASLRASLNLEYMATPHP